MKKEKKEDSFIKQPYYKGGDKALSNFINQNLIYPESSKANKIEGDVHIRIDINHKGAVIDAKIIGGLDDACNEEALRVVKLLKYEVPKTPRHIKVTFHKNLRIHFHIQSAQLPVHPNNDSTEHIQQVQNHYNIIITPTPVNTAPKKPAPTTYQYVIKLS